MSAGHPALSAACGPVCGLQPRPQFPFRDGLSLENRGTE